MTSVSNFQNGSHNYSSPHAIADVVCSVADKILIPRDFTASLTKCLKAVPSRLIVCSIKIRSKKIFAANSAFLVRLARPILSVLFPMGTSSHDDKILNRIVQLVPIPMVNVLGRKHRSSQVCFHNVSVFRYHLFLIRDTFVSTTDIPATISSPQHYMRATMFPKSHVMFHAKPFGVLFTKTPLHFTQPLARIVQRIHIATVDLYGEIRKGLLSFIPHFSY